MDEPGGRCFQNPEIPSTLTSVVVDVGIALDLGLLVGGLLLLIKGGDFLVDGSADLAAMKQLSPVLIGMTIVAFGTSLPELAVNVIASLDGESELALGNIVGSNIANILLILGLTALVYPVATTMAVVRQDMPILIGLTLLTVLLAVNLTGDEPYELDRMDGALLAVIFLLIVVSTVRRNLKIQEVCLTDPEQCGISPEEFEDLVTVPEGRTARQCWLLIVGGLVGVVLGGRLLVTGAVGLAESYGLDRTVIGLTIVAFGTSLPELVTSSIAAMKKHPGLVLGNVIGSNMFNLFILGLAAIISPLGIAGPFLTDMLLMSLFTFMLLIFLYTGLELERWEGGLFVACYAGYMGYVVLGAIG